MSQQQKVGRPNDSQPDEFQNDLHPQSMAGQNYSLQGAQTEYPLNAYEIKELHSQLKGFTSDEMKQITVLPVGSPLEQGTKYVDLMDPERKEFTAKSGMEAGPNHRYVPKKDLDYQLWNRLIGV